MKRALLLAGLLACGSETLVVTAPPPPVPVTPTGFRCNVQDSVMLIVAREQVALGASLTTAWYDSTGPSTAQGLSGHGCLAGFLNNSLAGA